MHKMLGFQLEYSKKFRIRCFYSLMKVNSYYFYYVLDDKVFLKSYFTVIRDQTNARTNSKSVELLCYGYNALTWL